MTDSTMPRACVIIAITKMGEQKSRGTANIKNYTPTECAKIVI